MLVHFVSRKNRINYKRKLQKEFLFGWQDICWVVED